MNVFYHKFTLNGYPHKIQHSDWFAGKLVGLAIVKYLNIKINIYVTHLHANYSVESLIHNQSRYLSDEYLPHRLAQLYELGQFITQTCESAHMSLLLGDLNTCDYETGYKMLRHHSSMLDAFREKQNFNKSLEDLPDLGSTCHVKSNVYGQTCSEIKSAFPNGIRIDYILFRSKNGNFIYIDNRIKIIKVNYSIFTIYQDVDVKCLSCKNCFGRIEGKNLNYSDHEGVQAEFEIKSKNFL